MAPCGSGWPCRLAVASLIAAAVWFVPAPAPATITEQRQRLPPPAECEDAIAGVWKSHKYNPQFGDWEIFHLRIHRVDGSDTELTGSLTNHSWQGGPLDEEPPPCRGFEWIVAMDGRGTFDPAGNRLRFGGVGQWRLDRVVCQRGPLDYNLDHFSGQIDHEIQEFQSVNNDGGRAVNIPTVFRRISCFNPQAEQAPTVETTPPPFLPEEGRGGCSFW